MTKGLNITNVTPKNDSEDIKADNTINANKNMVDLSYEPEINEGKQEIEVPSAFRPKTNGQQKQYKQQLISSNKEQRHTSETANGHCKTTSPQKDVPKPIKESQRPVPSVGEMDWVEWAGFMENQILKNATFIMTEVNKKSNYTLRQPNRRNQVVSYPLVVKQCAALESRIERLFRFKKLTVDRKKKLFETVEGLIRSSQGATDKYIAETLGIVNNLNKMLDKIESSSVLVQENGQDNKAKRRKTEQEE